MILKCGFKLYNEIFCLNFEYQYFYIFKISIAEFNLNYSQSQWKFNRNIFLNGKSYINIFNSLEENNFENR